MFDAAMSSIRGKGGAIRARDMSTKSTSTVLVINDDVSVGRRTADALGGLGFCVRTYSDAATALDAIVRGDPVSLIVSDLCMPGIDGWRFTRLLRQFEDGRGEQTRAPVLLVSSTFSGPDAEQVSRMAGADAFLSSYDPALLRLRARDLLNCRKPSIATSTLILDRDTARAGGLKSAFEENGHAAVVAASPADVDVSAELRPDMMVVSFELLTNSDIAGVRRIRREDSHELPLVVSDVPSGTSLSVLLSLGCDEYVSEGSSPRRCVRICEELYRERSLMRAVKSLEERTQSLRESEERYRSLFENAHDMIQILSADGRFQFVNPAWLRTMGYGWNELAQINFLDVLAPDSQSLARATLQAIHEGRDMQDVKLLLVSRSGSRIEVEATFSCVMKEGRVVGAHGMLRDVSERSQLELQLFQAQKLESIGTLAGGIAHDFNNILTAILGYSELACDAVPAESEAQRLIAEVTRQGRRAGDLVMRLLTFARRSAPERRPISLANMASETLDVLRRTLPRGISVRAEIPPSSGVVNADPTQITQVIMNLCVNAAQAMPQGGTLDVAVDKVTLDHKDAELCRDSERKPFVLLTVRDTGVGMSDAVMKRIFEPFFTTKPEGEGTGLGLSVVYGIVKSHDGFIRVDSKPGEGSTFKVFFPALPVAAAHVSHAKESLYTGDETILIVDDEPAVLEIAKRILEGLGYQVFAARDGREAIDLYRHLIASGVVIDMVFTDIVMPRMDGIELHKKLQELDSDLRVLFASGNITEADLAGKGSNAMRGFIRKPYGHAQLSKAVRAILDPPRPTHDPVAAPDGERSVREESRI